MSQATAGQAMDVQNVGQEHIKSLLFDEQEYAYLVPVPQLDQHVIRACQQVWLRWMDCNAADVVCVGLKGLDLVHGVVVVHSDKHVI